MIGAQAENSKGAPAASAADDAADTEEGYTRQLLRAWLNERNAPEILPFQFQLVEDAIELVDNQMERIEGEAGQPRSSTVESAFVRCLYQIEIERIKYILQNYLLARIKKIERFCFHLRQLSRAALVALLSMSEIEHLSRYRAMTEEALREAVLAHLPATLQGLGEDGAGMAAPRLSSHVVARVQRDFDELPIDPDTKAVETNVKGGDLLVLKYAAVKPLLQKGFAELI